MRLFTDPVVGGCNPLFWGLQFLWHPVGLLAVILAYQILNVIFFGLHYASSQQLLACLVLWLEVTCWLGLLAPAGLLMWIYGGFLYRQTDCKIFALEHSSNKAWHNVNLAGVSARCLCGAFVFSHLYPTLFCLLSASGRLSTLGVKPEACWGGACELASRLKIWLAFAILPAGVCIFFMHWCSWWCLESLWNGKGGAIHQKLMLALSLGLPVVVAMAVLALLDPDGSLWHASLVLGCFAFVACLGRWSRWQQRSSRGWLLPLAAAVAAAVLAFGLCAHARRWYGEAWGRQPEELLRSLEEDAAGDCLGLHWHPRWIAWARELDAEAGKLAARKVRALTMCAISLPACVMSFLRAVQSRGNRLSQDTAGCFNVFLGIVSVLLGSIINLLLYQQQPDTLDTFGFELVRWLLINALCILAVVAFKLCWDPASSTCAACRPCLSFLLLCAALACAYLAAALLDVRLLHPHFDDWEDLVQRSANGLLRIDAQREAAHAALFIAAMLALSYLARSAYWRRHWQKRWQLTPLDHQGLNSAHRLGVLPGPDRDAEWAYDSIGEAAAKEDTTSSEEFWHQRQRLVYGTRARMLHLQMPLTGLSFWQQLGLYGKSLTLTVQATTGAVWRYMDRLGDLKGFAPPVVAPSQLLSLWAPAAFARVCRLLIVLCLWYGEYLMTDRSTSSSLHAKEDVVGEIGTAVSGPLKRDVVGLGAGAAGAWGRPGGGANVSSRAAQVLGREEAAALDSFEAFSLPYRYALLANVLVSIVVALYWRAVGLFSLSDSVMQAAVIFVDSDSQCRKIILLRDGVLHPVVKIAWVLATVTTQCLLPLRSLLQSRYWLNPCILLDVLLQQRLAPSAAHALAVSAADLKDALSYNAMLFDCACTQAAALATSSALAVFGSSGAVTLTDLCLFAFQFLKAVKDPVDAYSLRLMRTRAICDAIQKQRDDKLVTIWGIPPGSCVRRFVGMENDSGINLETTSWVQLPEELQPRNSLQDDIGWPLTFTEVPVRVGYNLTERRLAAHLTIPDSNFWAIWTLHIEGRSRWFRRREVESAGQRSREPQEGNSPAKGEAKGEAALSMEGQWARWYPHDVRASAKEVFRIEGTKICRPDASAEHLVQQTERVFAIFGSNSWTGRLLETNDWGMLKMSNGSKWVRTGPQALVEGMMYNDIRVSTRYDCFSDTTGVLTFQWGSRTETKHLKGVWTDDYHVFQLVRKVDVDFGQDAFTVLYLRFRPGAVVVYVQYGHRISPVPWTMSPAAEKVETSFHQTFTGESVAGRSWQLPSVSYPGWWWSKLRCTDWSPPLEGHACLADTRDHPRFNYHKGPGRLTAHHDPEAREAVNKKDAFNSPFFLGTDMVEIDRVTLVLHACTREFNGPTCCESMDPSGRCYAAAAESEGYEDGLDIPSSPVELHAMLWPDVDRSAELSDDGSFGYTQVGSSAGPPEEDPSSQGAERRALVIVGNPA